MVVARIPTIKVDGDVRLVNLGDVHRGDANHDHDTFMRVVAFIRDNPDVLWLSTGDLLNVALTSSISDVYTSMNLQSEFDTLVGELRGLEARCVGVVASNHHNRFDRAVGMSLDRLLCRELGVPFLGKTGVVQVMAGGVGYMIAMAHGYGGGRTRGAKANNLARFMSIYPGADLYMKGHTHSYESFIAESLLVDRRKLVVREHRCHCVTTGHFLRWKGSYAEEKEFESAPRGAALVTLISGTRAADKRITCELLT